MAELPTWLFTTVSPLGALIGFVVLVGILIVKGKLIPESLHDRIVAAQAETIKVQTEALESAYSQIEAQNQVGETVLAIVNALPRGGDSE